MYRQGELLFKKISKEQFQGFKGEKLNHRVIAEGETTGHKHELNNGILYKQRWNNTLFLEISKEGAILTHPEHKPITFEQGFFEVITQREYTEQGIRKVRD